MEEQNANANTAEENVEQEQTEQPMQAESGFNLQTVDRKYYAPADLQQASAEVQEIVEGLGELQVEPVYNFNPDDGLPDGYGLAIIPLSKRVPQEGNVNVNVCIAAIPDPETISKTDGGGDWIYSTLTSALLAKVANNARPKQDGSSAGSLPFSVNDFITSQRQGENLEAWKKFGPRYAKSLREKGKGRRIRQLTVSVLKQILQSSEFAESMFRSIPQAVWVKVLDAIIADAKKENMDTSALEHWKETRDSAEMQEPSLDLEDLADLG